MNSRQYKNRDQTEVNHSQTVENQREREKLKGNERKTTAHTKESQ